MMDAAAPAPELLAPDARSFEEAHRALMAAFEPMRAFCCWTEAPFGPVFVAKTSKGICRVSFRRSEDELLGEMERRGLLPEVSPERLDEERRQLEEYFHGRRRDFELDVDLREGTPFQRKVLEATRKIPFGAHASYKSVAEDIGHRRAHRAVGNALGRNPIAIVIPCHRVTASDGRMGGYTGGLDIKRTLMDIEGIEMGANA